MRFPKHMKGILEKAFWNKLFSLFCHQLIL